ncbi:MAG: peroxiredoxin [Acidobacteriota bacterium]|nr:peroxiredoxin [Acidobacteriota bacterium]
MIQEGDQFPPFQLPDENGKERSLKDLTGDTGLVLYVYPKDNTPGCTVEAQDFRDQLETFRQHGYAVAGISKDSAKSHCNFIDKYDLTFPLLTDADAELLSQIGAFGEKKNYGRVYQGIIRSTFLVAADGTLQKAYRNVRAKGHVERVLRDLEG